MQTALSTVSKKPQCGFQVTRVYQIPFPLAVPLKVLLVRKLKVEETALMKHFDSLVLAF